MDNHPTATPAESIAPPLLGDLIFNPSDNRPLGGLNYYSSTFNESGQALVNFLITLCNLSSGKRILDIGCGTGRLISPLINIINPALYHGLEINSRYLNICREKHKTCKFTHLDLKHDEYNPSGTIDPYEFEYPYPDRSFDVICAFGVYNHNRTKAIMQSLRSVSRLLKPKAIFICTILLLNQNSMTLINNGKTNKPFVLKHKSDDGWAQFDHRPLLNIATSEMAVRRVCIQSRMMLSEPIRYGHWISHPHALNTHDVLVAVKQG
jgi:SAM-dependent methyltransferase